MSNESIDNLARLLAETLPQGLRSARDDLEKNFRSVLQSGLTKLDLVTREEFAVQEAVLARTREKLDALEDRLADLARTASAKKPAKKPSNKQSSRKKLTKKKAGSKKAG